MTAHEPNDESWMQQALALAREAERAGEVPVGAVVVRNGAILGRGFNRNISDSDPTAHAEVVALRQAARKLGNHRLEGCALFATIEPCAMCAGALVHARIARLIYGADDPKAGAVRSVMQVVNHSGLNHQMAVTRGVLGDECAQLLQQFFQARRGS
jgi:tRNA(adenine34) deaminase